jgi:hypothetical protein
MEITSLENTPQRIAEQIVRMLKNPYDEARGFIEMKLDEIRRAALEEAAKIATTYFPQSKWDLHDVREIEAKRVCEEIAKEIRALMEKDAREK